MAGGLQGSGRAVPGMDMRILKSRPQQAGPVFVRQREQRLGCEKVLLVFTEQHTLEPKTGHKKQTGKGLRLQ